MIRAKLIGPTNVLLEHPLLSPVSECEFFLIGRREYLSNRYRWIEWAFMMGMTVGLLVAGVIILLAQHVK